MSIRRAIGATFSTRILSAIESNPDELWHGAQISIWVRWVILAGVMAEVNYRVDYGAVSHILNTLYIASAMALNGYVHYRIRSNKAIATRWMLLLSFADVVFVSFSTSLSGGLASRYFIIYYFVVASFATTFTSLRLNVLWVTVVALIYAALCTLVPPGISFEEEQDKVLFYRLSGLYAVMGLVNLIIRVERTKRREAVEREGELHRQRIEISQTIHDTAAQWAYLIGLGIEAAAKLGDRSNREQIEKLDATAQLSKALMWELRHPIDGGQIFQGRNLNHVLRAHASTFTTITSVPAEFMQTGEEPPLSTVVRSLLFSTAHNALTNAYRHAQAESVILSLEFGTESLRMSVVDDGIGLPEDFAGRGHGFRNMRANAERMGGRLDVGRGASGRGTTVTCVVPYGTTNGG